MNDMKLAIVDEDVALGLLHAAVTRRGDDYVYPNANQDGTNQCRYWHHDQSSPEDDTKGEPGCIIGLALHIHGVPAETLCWLDTLNGGNGASADDLNCALAEVTSGAAQVFNVAQKIQDMAQTWGEALSRAIEVHDLMKKTDDLM